MKASDPKSRSQLLQNIRTLADQDRPHEALNILNGHAGSDPAIANAEGVCLLRAGRTAKAVEVFRRLCVGDGIGLRPNASAVHVTNFATALLLAGNLQGCKYHLHHVGSSHPAAEQVRAAITKWERSLNGWQRLRYRLGMYEPKEPISLEGPPGTFQ